MAPEKKISDEDFINMYESKDRRNSRLDKYFKEDEPKQINFSWWLILAVVFLIAYLLFSKYLFPPKL
jgi:hypothetical protein